MELRRPEVLERKVRPKVGNLRSQKLPLRGSSVMVRFDATLN